MAAITASTNFTRGRFGLPPLPEEVIRAEVGYGLPQLVAKLVPAALPDEAVAVYSAHHATVCAGLTVLYPGVAETLAKLYAMGLRMAVCSNKRVAFTKHLVDPHALGAERVLRDFAEVAELI